MYPLFIAETHHSAAWMFYLEQSRILIPSMNAWACVERMGSLSFIKFVSKVKMSAFYYGYCLARYASC